MKGPAVIIIVNACLWGFAMIMSAHALRGTGAYQQIQHILGGCAAASMLVVLSGLVLKPKKPEQRN
jgi:hypothetical protein